jgi:hypothetical protein
MKSENEIRLKLLDLYQGREKYSQASKSEKDKRVQVTNSLQLVAQVYSEKISVLEWVLNSDSAKIWTEVEPPPIDLAENSPLDATES